MSLARSTSPAQRLPATSPRRPRRPPGVGWPAFVESGSLLLVRRDDRGRDLGALQQLVVVGDEEISLGVLGEFLADLGVGVAQASQPMPG